MTDASEDATSPAPLPPALHGAIGKYRQWADEHLKAERDTNTIDTPLYRYTDGHGLKGIIADQRIWFTDYRHMNDPSELIHGMEVGRGTAAEIALHADKRVQMFLETLIDMFTQANFETSLEFFIQL